jgi:hypothetical protein
MPTCLLLEEAGTHFSRGPPRAGAIVLDELRKER